MKTSLLLSLLAAVKSSYAAYAIQDDYTADKFWDMFDFFTDADPTQGFVKYVDYNTAMNGGLVSTTNNTVRIAADSKNTAPGGRNSVRLTSKAAYNSGLIILDLAHMPGSICGSWPAFWTVGPDWPNNGEIDIIEGVNSNTANQMTLHTANSPGCSISGNDFTGKVASSNCYVNAAGQAENAGCAVQATAANTYGDGFNSAGGGVYATQWTDSGISVFHFARGSIPADITAGTPNPSGWGQPAAQWLSSGCNIGAIFKNHNIVFDLTFCGSWAGQVWGNDGTCKAKSGSCNDYVANNPAAFEDAYWVVNSLQVYQDNGAAAPAATAATSKASTVTPAAATGATGTTASPAAASSASESVVESVITVTITETTLLSIPFPTSTGTGGAQLLSGILTSATVTAPAEMLAVESESPAAAIDKEAVSTARHWRRHIHHNRGLHGHEHMH